MTPQKNYNRYTFGLGTVGRDMVYTLISMYLMFYLTDVLHLSDDVLWWVTGIILAVVEPGITQTDIRVVVFVRIVEIGLAFHIIPLSHGNQERIDDMLHIF